MDGIEVRLKDGTKNWYKGATDVWWGPMFVSIIRKENYTIVDEPETKLFSKKAKAVVHHRTREVWLADFREESVLSAEALF